MMGILFEKRNVDDSGFPRTPDRPVELLGTRVRYPRSVKTMIGACGPDSLGGSATGPQRGIFFCYIFISNRTRKFISRNMLYLSCSLVG